MNINFSDNKTFALLLGLATLFVMGILFYGLGGIPLMSFNEARRAIPIEDMFEHHHFLLPYLNGELYIDKPPLFYWFGLLISKVVGVVNEWTIRLVSALAALGVIAYAAYITHKIASRWHVLLVIVVLITCTNFVTFARRSEIEMLLTLLCTSSLLCAFDYICLNGKRACLYISYALMGLAILCKGPVALLFVQAPVMVMAFQNAKARDYLSSIVGWLLLLFIGGSWYAVVTLNLGADIWHQVVQADIKNKVAGTKSDPFYDYALFMLADFAPWTLILLCVPLKTVKAWWSDDKTRFLLIGVLVPFIVLSLFANKHAKYFLSAYPAIAILVAFALVNIFQQWRGTWQKIFVALAVALPLAYFVYFAVFEAIIFKYRFNAPLQLQEVATQFNHTPMISYKDIDMRSVYYYGEPIRIVKKADEIASSANGSPMLLFLEKDTLLKQIDITGWQTIEIIKPYFSQDQSAVLLGNAAFVKQYAQQLPIHSGD